MCPLSDTCQPIPHAHTNQSLHFCAHSNTILKHSSEGDGVGKREAHQTGIQSWGKDRREDAVEGVRHFEHCHLTDSTHLLLRGWQRRTLQ